MQISYNIDNEKPNESCGIVGIYSLDQDISAGAQVLLHSMIKLADNPIKTNKNI